MGGMNMLQGKVSYKPFKHNACYLILVTRKLLTEQEEYTIALQEEGEYFNTEVFDLDLRRPSHRRRLEDYTAEIRKKACLKGVYFDDIGCLGANYKPIEKYREEHDDRDYLKDLDFQRQ